MFGLFKKTPVELWHKDRQALLSKAFNAQRNGNIRLYSTLTAEAEALRAKIELYKSSDSAEEPNRKI